MGSERRVLVAGDATVDWNLARRRRTDGAAEPAEAVRAAPEPGGAALLHRLLSAVVDATQLGVTVEPFAVPVDALSSADDRLHRSFALWSQVGGDGDPAPWRIERFLGVDRAASRLDVPNREEDPRDLSLVVLDDAGLGFRDDRSAWARAISGAGEPWVLLKMSRPVARGPLWDELKRRADRLIVVARIDDLRLSEVQISRELSWERTAQDLMWEFVFNPELADLASCAHVIVSFTTAGALLFTPRSRGDDVPRTTLFFDPRVMEDMWLEEHPGAVVGYTSSLAAAVAYQVLRAPDAPDVPLGIQRGLIAMRALHLGGFDERAPASGPPSLAFPIDRVVVEVTGEAAPFAVAEVRDPTASSRSGGAATVAEPSPWTILEDRYPDGLEDVARRIVLEGPDEVLRDVPRAEFGKLLTVDRQEIEGFRSIRSLIREYARDGRAERPLSIAVFGPPGSGKSFGVKQVARSVLSGRIEDLTFNLSQFDDPSQLRDALHQVRDASLRGNLPLVFWDEFDAALGGEELGWLRHFLAPMQDGTFHEGEITHPIGPAVFVFAGGTRARMQEFAFRDSPEFRDAKGPDFVSRLKGYVNILGPNPREGDALRDPHHLIRRAILLHTMLASRPQVSGRHGIRIDDGVLRAFLETRVYRHGARSMESIVAMSLLAGKSRFERSCLPSEDQLDLHVDARDFLSRVLQPALTGASLDRLAEAAHVVYCEEMLTRGKAWAGDEDYLLRHPPLRPFVGRRREPATAHPQLVPFDQLEPEHVEQNRDLVRFMAHNLRSLGYLIWPERGGARRVELSDEEVEFLAEQEHERWMRRKLADGWCYGADLDRERRRHSALVPWAKLADDARRARYGAYADCVGPGELPDDQRETDRVLVRKYDRYLALAGYTVVRLEG